MGVTYQSSGLVQFEFTSPFPTPRLFMAQALCYNVYIINSIQSVRGGGCHHMTISAFRSQRFFVGSAGKDTNFRSCHQVASCWRKRNRETKHFELHVPQKHVYSWCYATNFITGFYVYLEQLSTVIFFLYFPR